MLWHRHNISIWNSETKCTSRDDLRQLFAHSSAAVTDRYIRGRFSNLERVGKLIRLFPERWIRKIQKSPKWIRKADTEA